MMLFFVYDHLVVIGKVNFASINHPSSQLVATVIDVNAAN